MGVAKSFAVAAGVVTVSWTLAACSNAPTNGIVPSGPSAATTTRLVEPTTGGHVLYASLFEGELYAAYELPHKKPFCQSQLVEGTLVNSIGVDAMGTLWIPTQVSGAPRIDSFAPKCGAKGTSLSVPVTGSPIGIAFGANGTKYALIMYFGPDGNNNDSTSVAVYPTGATSPKAELSDTRLNKYNYVTDGIGTDSAGDVFVTCCDDAKAKVKRFAIEFTAGGNQNKGKKIVLQQMTAPGLSVSFDKANNMLVPDDRSATIGPESGASLNVYAPPYTGAPKIYPLQGSPGQCSLSPAESLLACANVEANTVDLYAYPSMRYRYSVKLDPYTFIQVGGVAFAP